MHKIGFALLLEALKSWGEAKVQVMDEEGSSEFAYGVEVLIWGLIPGGESVVGFDKIISYQRE